MFLTFLSPFFFPLPAPLLQTPQVRGPLPVHGRAGSPDQCLAGPRSQLGVGESLHDLQEPPEALGPLLRHERREGGVEVPGGAAGEREEAGGRRAGGGEWRWRFGAGRKREREREKSKKKTRKTKKNSPPQLLLFFPLLSPLSNLPLSLFPSKQTSEVTCATVDNNFRPCRIPEQVRPDLERGAAWFAAGSGSGKI